MEKNISFNFKCSNVFTFSLLEEVLVWQSEDILNLDCFILKCCSIQSIHGMAVIKQ